MDRLGCCNIARLNSSDSLRTCEAEPGLDRPAARLAGPLGDFLKVRLGPDRASGQLSTFAHTPRRADSMVVSLASAGGAAKIYCVNGGGSSNKNAAAWLEAKLGKTRKRRGGQGGTGGEGEIRLIQVSRVCSAGWCISLDRLLTLCWCARRTLSSPRRPTRSRPLATASTSSQRARTSQG